MDLQVGQIVFVKRIGNAARYESRITEEVVESIGRKWFTLKDFRRERFSLDDGLNDGKGYISNYAVYVSMQEIEDEKEHSKLCNILNREFSSYGDSNLSLKTLRKIIDIIAEERAALNHTTNGSTVPAQEPSPKLPEQNNNGVR
mgnify:CR=1 FL=1